MTKTISTSRMLPVFVVAIVLLFAGAARATTPGITATSGTPGSFNLVAQDSYISQPDGSSIYTWGYGCASGSTPSFVPATITTFSFCPAMQIPGPTLVVTEGSVVSVTLTNQLPTVAGNTSIIFSGFMVTAAASATQPAPACTTGPGGTATAQGLLTLEATPGCSITYTFTASTPGTHSYYSGTQGDLQVEMGLYGAVVVLPANTPANCTVGNSNPGIGSLSGIGSTLGFANHNGDAESWFAENDYRLAAAAYDHPGTCYDREYIFQFSEMDPNIHSQALAQVLACQALTPGTPCSLNVPTEPYHPAYFMVNGRSMPDDMDPNYSAFYPHQPYNGNPHAHPGENVLVRVIGQGRWQHPFHEHGNHVRILGRDGNLILSGSNINYTNTGNTTVTVSAPALAGPLLFTTTTTPGQAFDGIFYWTGRGLNWDPYGHEAVSKSSDIEATLPCVPDSNGYYTIGTPSAPAWLNLNYFEWCQDHNKPLETFPTGDVGAGGPVTLPFANILTTGAWYGGSPYLGPDATIRADNSAACQGYILINYCAGQTSTTPPSGTLANPPRTEAGFAFMWQSHNEREITTGNAFPGGMLMMLLMDSREFIIDESK